MCREAFGGIFHVSREVGGTCNAAIVSGAPWPRACIHRFAEVSQQLQPALPRGHFFFTSSLFATSANKVCASAISGKSGVGEKPASAGASTACASAARPADR